MRYRWRCSRLALSPEKRKPTTISATAVGSTVTAVVDAGDVDRWSKTEPVILQIGTEPPQILIADPDAPDADSYKNKDYEFYALKKFITLTHKNHGVVVKFYDTCRIE